MSNLQTSLPAASLITRLSLIILAQTLVTFLGIWLLFFFPGQGANEKDLLEQESRMKDLAHRAGRAAALRDDTGSDPEEAVRSSALIKRIFVETQADYEGVQRQVIYRLTDDHLPGSAMIVEEWVDDLGAAMRTGAESRAAELEFVQAMRSVHSGAALRVLTDYGRVTWYSLWVDGSQTSHSTEYVYQITLADSPPILGGRRFTYALAAFFLSSMLISLMMGLLLKKRLAEPLSALGAAFGKLAAENNDRGTPEFIDQSSSGSLGTLISGFNSMSKALSEKRDELLLSEQRLRNSNTELEKSKNFLETILESSPNAIIVSDLSGEITLFNSAGRSVFGFAENEDIPVDLDCLFVANSSCQWPREFDLSGALRYERVCVRADGSSFPALVVVSPLKSPAGATSGYLYLVRDISESENFKEMMMRLDHLSIRGEMAGDIAHEINNFLAVIQGNAELLPVIIKGGDREKLGKRLGLITDTVTKIAGFTEGLMNFESQELTFTSEDINQLIHNLLVFLKPQKRLDHVNMVLEVDNELGMVTIDSGMIQQTIVNLIYNAADALNEDGNQGARGEVTIRTQKLKTGRALIAVSDNGPGVPEEKRETLFTERFTTKPKGHGIGLITCAKIIEAHSGRISYEEGPQGGASFVIEIPLRQPEMTRTDTQPLALGPKSPRRTLPARS